MTGKIAFTLDSVPVEAAPGEIRRALVREALDALSR